MTTKEPWKAAVLNLLLPGLGHVYARKWKKGIYLYVVSIAIFFGVRLLAISFFLLVSGIALSMGFYIYLAVSGYKAVEKNKYYPDRSLDKWYYYVIGLLLILSLAEALKEWTFKFTPYINFAGNPTPAMQPALQVGDCLAYQRTKAISRNDVVVFKYPTEPQTLFVKRCIGLPGDNLKIQNKRVYINGVSSDLRTPLKFSYFLNSNGTAISDAFFKEQGITDYTVAGADNYLLHLTDEEAKKLKTFEFVRAITPLVANKGELDIALFPNSHYVNWNTDFYGPLYIPKKESEIQLNEINIAIYGKYIQAEDSTLKIINNEVFQNSIKLEKYRFKKNYYFMMGDNRHNSSDSRYWGFVLEDLIIGKTLYLPWSKNYSRIGKKVI